MELLRSGIAAIATLLVLGWGQNIKAIEIRKIKPQQAATACGVMAMGYYSWQKEKNKRQRNKLSQLSQQILADLESQKQKLADIVIKT